MRRLLLDHLTGAVLPPDAEPPLVIDHDGGGVPDQSERSDSFELVHHLRSAQSIEVKGTTTSMRMLGGLVLLDLAPHVQLMAIWPRHAPKRSVKWPKESKIPLDPVQLESLLRINPSRSLAPEQIWNLPTFFPLQSLSTIWVQPHHNYSLPSICPSNVYLTNMPQRNALGRVSMPIKKREQKGKRSLLMKIPCMLQMETGIEMRRWPRRGQYRDERVNPPTPTPNRGLHGRKNRLGKRKG